MIPSLIKNVIHHGMTCGWGIAHSEEHYHWFIEPPIGFKCHLPFIPFLNSDFVVDPLDVQFGEVLPIFDLVHQFGDQGEGVSIFNHPLI